LPTVLLARLLGLSEDSSRCAAIHFECGLDGADLMIPLSHANILSNVQGLAAMVDLSAGDRVLATLPLHGAFGRTTTLFAPLLSGATIALAPGRRDAEAVAEFVEGVGVTHLVGTASQARACLVGVAAERFKGLKLAFVGGEEAVGQELVEAWSERFGSALLTGHGRTECGPVISLNVPDIEIMGSREEGARVGTVGRALPGTALRVVDPKSGAALPPGTAGVLEVKGPGVASGYLDDEERSVSCFREGWFSTGERAVIDKHGFCQDLPRELEA
jgi:acyl-[acyl-carrier-protein]-phospholipid O-acyltransferase/long-chain-fatty-acid--[acyl-carrier-protein] ligase